MPLVYQLRAADLRGLFDANSLVLRHSEVMTEERDLEYYLDLAGCHGSERENARALAPARLRLEVGWYVLVKPGF